MEQFFELYKAGWQKYIKFDGRACRAEICAFTIPHILIMLWFMIYFFSSAMSFFVTRGKHGELGPMFLIVFIFAVVTFIPTLSVIVRRLHDLNQTGWICLVIALVSRIPIIGIFVSFIWLILLYLTPGTYGRNKYGPESEMY